MKYYVENGRTRRTLQASNPFQAALFVLTGMLEKEEPLGIITFVTVRGFIEDLAELDMTKEFNDGKMMLTTHLLNELIKQVDVDSLKVHISEIAVEMEKFQNSDEVPENIVKIIMMIESKNS
jgi:hypothetical protein